MFSCGITCALGILHAFFHGIGVVHWFGLVWFGSAGCLIFSNCGVCRLLISVISTSLFQWKVEFLDLSAKARDFDSPSG